MEDETPHDELMRLLKAQLKTRQDEIYCGLSQTEKTEYDRRAERIRELVEGAAEGAQIGELRKRSA